MGTRKDESDQDLIRQLEELEKEEKRLTLSIRYHKKKSEKYHAIYKKSPSAIWEEDYSDVYEKLRVLPCSSREEYETYLRGHPGFLGSLISMLRITDCNDAVPAMFGAESKEQLLSSLDKVFIDESRDSLIGQFSVLGSGGNSFECRTVGRRFDGEEFQLLMSVFFTDIRGASALVSMLDLTDRIKLEEKRQAMYQQMAEDNILSRSLLDMTMALSSRTNMDDILDTILKEAGEIVPYDTANIILKEEDHFKILRHKGYESYGTEKVFNEYFRDSVSMGAASTFRGSKEILVIRDTSEYPGWVYHKETAYIQSVLSIPLKLKNEVIGVLTLDSAEKNTFCRNDAEKLSSLSHAAAIMLQKADLLGKTDKDISERKLAEEGLKQSLEEKEVLLGEIHHRVKNNLAIIIALINLQDEHVSSPEEKELLEDLNQRIHTIALVHENLYETPTATSIDFYSYVSDLIGSIRQLYCGDCDMQVVYDIPEHINFHLDTLIPLGLIMNELLTNVMKYAFAPHQEAVVHVSLEHTDDGYLLQISDSGKGYPVEVLKGQKANLGLILVKSLSQQVKGRLTLENRKGAVTTLAFPESVRRGAL